MTLVDRRFAAELVTRTGREFRFDDIGCLATFLADSGAELTRDGKAWVNDYLAPGHWLAIDSARYLRSSTLPTPMASGLVALAPGAPVDSVRQALAATQLTWAEVLAEAARPGR